jgi:alanine racemase
MTDAASVADWNLTPSVYSHVFLEALAEHAERIPPVHLKLDTGMHRVGADLATVTALARQAPALGVEVGGLWTHFASSESDSEFTDFQVALLGHAVEHLGSSLPADAIVHHSNTGGAILRGTATWPGWVSASTACTRPMYAATSSISDRRCESSRTSRTSAACRQERDRRTGGVGP